MGPKRIKLEIELSQSIELEIIRRRRGTKRRLESTNGEAYKQHRRSVEAEDREEIGEEY